MKELSRYVVSKGGLLFSLDWFQNVDDKYMLPMGLLFTHVDGVVEDDSFGKPEFTTTHMINHVGPYEPSQNESYNEWYKKHYH
jgi:hypothetical protein